MINQNTLIGAITLKVADLDKMVTFYRDVIGLQVIGDSAESPIRTKLSNRNWNPVELK